MYVRMDRNLSTFGYRIKLDFYKENTMSSTYLAIQLVEVINNIEDILAGDSADVDKIKEIEEYIEWAKVQLDI